MEHFLFAFNALMPLLLLALIGYSLKKYELISAKFVSELNKFVFLVALPALIITTLVSIGDFSTVQWDVVLFGVAGIFIVFFLGMLVAKTLNTDNAYKPVITQAFFRGNFTLIGIPLALRLGGDETLQMIIILNAALIPITNILSIVTFKLWQNVKDERVSVKDIFLSTIKNPLMVSVFIGLMLYTFNQSFNTHRRPFIVYETLEFLSMSATPMALIAIGAQFEIRRIHAVKKPLIVSVLSRAFLVPITIFILGFFLRDFIDFTGSIAALIAIFASSVAVSSVAVTKGLEGDEHFASQVVIFSTGFSVFSIFFYVIIFRVMGLL